MNMHRLTETIKRHEGRRLLPYDDATGLTLTRGDTIKGHITIGYGRNLEEGITGEDAERFLEKDVSRAAKDVSKKLPFTSKLSEVRQEVLVNMCYNMGINRLLTFRRMIAALEDHDYAQAAEEMMDSRWAKQVGNRARELANVMALGYWP